MKLLLLALTISAVLLMSYFGEDAQEQARKKYAPR